MPTEYRNEKDSLGEMRVPANALYGPQTQRAVENFPISGQPLPLPFLHALGLVPDDGVHILCRNDVHGRPDHVLQQRLPADFM